MTRLLLTADWHLGAGTDYADDRLADQERTLAGLLDAPGHFDAILVLGDVFHRPRPTPRELLAAQRLIHELTQRADPVIIIAGNHDRAAASDPCILDLFEGDLGSVTVVTSPRIVRIDTLGGGIASIACLPWAPPAAYYAQASETDRDRLAGDVAGLLLEVANGMRPNTPATAILATHWSLSGASTPTGMQTTEFREPVIDTHALAAQGWDAIVAGHIHKAQTIAGYNHVRYVGSPGVVDFGEADTFHGAMILDTDAPAGEDPWMPVALEDRPFVTIDGRGDVPPVGSLDGAVVRIRYTATRAEAATIDHDVLRRVVMAAGAHRVYQITPTITDAVRARSVDTTADTGPAEAVEQWITQRDLDTAAADALRTQTVDLIERLR